MQAKKLSDKREKIAAAALGKKRLRPSDTAPHAHSSSSHVHPLQSATGLDVSLDAKRGKKQLGARKAPTFTRQDAISTTDDRAELIRSMGDNIDTRLKEITFDNELDDQLDADVRNERRQELMEEARLAAGTQQRQIARVMSAFLGGHSSSESSMTRIRHNSNSVTAVANLGTDLVVFGDKSGKVYLADLAADASASGMTTSIKLEQQRRKKVMLEPPMAAAVVSIAVSDTRHNRPSSRDLFEKTTVDMSCPSYIAVGAADGSIGVWESLTRTYKGLLFKHHKPVTGLSFRQGTATLRSVSTDGVLRVWSVPQMNLADTLFGHEGPVSAVHGLRRDTCATVGEDGTMRFWKVDAATQQAFSYTAQHRREAQGLPAPPPDAANKKDASYPIRLECVSMLNEDIVVCGAVDGSLVVFDTNRRKPVAVQLAAHGYGFIGDGTGLEKAAAQLDAETQKQAPTDREAKRNPNPITAVATVPYADVIASASHDGIVRLWRLHTPAGGAAELQLLAELPVPALIPALRFSPDGDALYVACSKEPRLGRWVVLRSALNSVLVVPLSELGLQLVQRLPGIEHVPALLYGYADEADEAEKTPSDEEEEEGEVKEEEEGSDADAHDRSHAAPAVVDTDASFFQVGADGQLMLNTDLLATEKGHNDVMRQPHAKQAGRGAPTVSKKKKLLMKKGGSAGGAAALAKKKAKQGRTDMPQVSATHAAKTEKIKKLKKKK